MSFDTSRPIESHPTYFDNWIRLTGDETPSLLLICFASMEMVGERVNLIVIKMKGMRENLANSETDDEVNNFVVYLNGTERCVFGMRRRRRGGQTR